MAEGIGAVDALVLLSFGGPDGPDDVIPFLENVTRGRGIPAARLEDVAGHYRHLGGRSPLNELNTEIIDHLRAELERRGRDLPVYFGNRNWSPFLGDTVREMTADGVRSAAVFVTSAWGGYSGCAQYQEDIARALSEVEGGPTLYRLRQFHDHPLFVERFGADLSSSLATAAPGARVVFTAHSVPDSADRASGPATEAGRLYSRQVAEAARLIAEHAGAGEYDVVWQSRSGPPSVPWLEPDVVDHVRDLVARGVTDVVVCPVGFVSDHVEVIWDLDTELVDEVADLGVTVTRCATPGPSREFTGMVLQLLEELETGETVQRLGTEPSRGCTRDGARCAVDCCPAPVRPARTT